MKRIFTHFKKHLLPVLALMALLGFSNSARSQEALVNMALLEGLDITPDNIFDFQIQLLGNQPVQSRIEGRLRYRNADHDIRWSFNYRLQPGMNRIRKEDIHPSWKFSSTALRELFRDYKVLPQGTYRYCVSVTPNKIGGEGSGEATFDDCLYKQAEDLFSITLTEPEDDAKIYEYYPMLSWVATYPFVSALTYRLRIAEIKGDQSTYNAITRNNPIYSESNLYTNTLTYPVYAKALQPKQPYAWTVDAYYKGLLLGGAQPWRFTIIEDSLLASIPRESAHLDIRREQGHSPVYAVGSLKLKYVLDERKSDTLRLELYSGDRKKSKLPETEWVVKYGDNRYEIDFKNKSPLRHMKTYTLKISTGAGSRYEVHFKYVNPDLLP